MWFRGLTMAASDGAVRALLHEMEGKVTVTPDGGQPA